MSVPLSLDGKTERFVVGMGLTAGETQFPPALHLHSHEHDTAYLCIVLDGTFAEASESRRTDATPGVVYYVPVGMPHTNAFGVTGARCLLLQMDRVAARRLREAGARLASPWLTAGGWHAWLGLRLYRRLKHNVASTVDIEEYLLTACGAESRAAVCGSQPPAWLRRAREALDVRPRRPPSIAALAAGAGVHPVHLIRAFRRCYGATPGEYIQARRVAEGCRLLLAGAGSVAQIALRLGFYDQSHFTRAFKARIGVPPGRYRSLGFPLAIHPGGIGP